MREQNGRSQDRESLVKGLKEKLNWFAVYASAEEFDEKAVDAILYLLDSLEPLETVKVPDPNEAWGRFQALVREREENHFAGMAEGEQAEVLGTLESTEALGKLKPTEMEEILRRLELSEAAEVLVKPEMMGAAELLGKPELLEMEEVLRRLESSEAAEVSVKPEMMEAAELLGKPELLEMEEVLSKLVAESATGVLGKLESVEAAEILEKSKPADTAMLEKSGAVAAAETLEKLESAEVAEMPEKAKLVDAGGNLERPQSVVMPESMTRVKKTSRSEESAIYETAEEPETLERVKMLEGLELSGNMAGQELANASEKAEKPGRTEKAKGTKGQKAAGMLEKGEETEILEELVVPTKSLKKRIPVRAGLASKSRMAFRLAENQKGAVQCNQYIVAAILLLLVISIVGVVGNVQVGASPDTGFFHWLKRDNTSIQMITSPEDLDSEADMQGVHIYSGSEDVPQWAQEWLEIDNEFEVPQNYEWDCYEVEEPRNFHKITSYYLDKTSKRELLLGIIMYYGEISFNTEGLVDFDYVDSYEINEKEMNIYNRVENTGEIFYMIYFYEGNCQYFMQGHNLDELKRLMEKYWFYVKNLKENEIICNKMLSSGHL